MEGTGHSSEKDKDCVLDTHFDNPRHLQVYSFTDRKYMIIARKQCIYGVHQR